MDDFDLYSDLFTDEAQEEKETDHTGEPPKDQYQKVVTECLSAASNLQEDRERLKNENNTLKQQNETLRRNISALFKTAKYELARKDRELVELKERLQNSGRGRPRNASGGGRRLDGVQSESAISILSPNGSPAVPPRQSSRRTSPRKPDRQGSPRRGSEGDPRKGTDTRPRKSPIEGSKHKTHENRESLREKSEVDKEPHRDRSEEKRHSSPADRLRSDDKKEPDRHRSRRDTDRQSARHTDGRRLDDKSRETNQSHRKSDDKPQRRSVFDRLGGSRRPTESSARSLSRETDDSRVRGRNTSPDKKSIAKSNTSNALPCDKPSNERSKTVSPDLSIRMADVEQAMADINHLVTLESTCVDSPGAETHDLSVVNSNDNSNDVRMDNDREHDGNLPNLSRGRNGALKITESPETIKKVPVVKSAERNEQQKEINDKIPANIDAGAPSVDESASLSGFMEQPKTLQDLNTEISDIHMSPGVPDEKQITSPTNIELPAQSSVVERSVGKTDFEDIDLLSSAPSTFEESVMAISSVGRTQESSCELTNICEMKKSLVFADPKVTVDSCLSEKSANPQFDVAEKVDVETTIEGEIEVEGAISPPEIALEGKTDDRVLDQNSNVECKELIDLPNSHESTTTIPCEAGDPSAIDIDKLKDDAELLVADDLNIGFVCDLESVDNQESAKGCIQTCGMNEMTGIKNQTVDEGSEEKNGKTVKKREKKKKNGVDVDRKNDEKVVAQQKNIGKYDNKKQDPQNLVKKADLKSSDKVSKKKKHITSRDMREKEESKTSDSLDQKKHDVIKGMDKKKEETASEDMVKKKEHRISEFVDEKKDQTSSADEKKRQKAKHDKKRDGIESSRDEKNDQKTTDKKKKKKDPASSPGLEKRELKKSSTVDKKKNQKTFESVDERKELIPSHDLDKKESSTVNRKRAQNASKDGILDEVESLQTPNSDFDNTGRGAQTESERQSLSKSESNKNFPRIVLRTSAQRRRSARKRTETHKSIESSLPKKRRPNFDISESNLSELVGDIEDTATDSQVLLNTSNSSTDFQDNESEKKMPALTDESKYYLEVGVTRCELDRVDGTIMSENSVTAERRSPRTKSRKNTEKSEESSKVDKTCSNEKKKRTSCGGKKKSTISLETCEKLDAGPALVKDFNDGKEDLLGLENLKTPEQKKHEPLRSPDPFQAGSRPSSTSKTSLAALTPLWTVTTDLDGPEAAYLFSKAMYERSKGSPKPQSYMVLTTGTTGPTPASSGDTVTCERTGNPSPQKTRNLKSSSGITEMMNPKSNAESNSDIVEKSNPNTSDTVIPKNSEELHTKGSCKVNSENFEDLDSKSSDKLTPGGSEQLNRKTSDSIKVNPKSSEKPYSIMSGTLNSKSSRKLNAKSLKRVNSKAKMISNGSKKLSNIEKVSGKRSSGSKQSNESESRLSGGTKSLSKVPDDSAAKNCEDTKTSVLDNGADNLMLATQQSVKSVEEKSTDPNTSAGKSSGSEDCDTSNLDDFESQLIFPSAVENKDRKSSSNDVAEKSYLLNEGTIVDEVAVPKSTKAENDSLTESTKNVISMDVTDKAHVVGVPGKSKKTSKMMDILLGLCRSGYLNPAANNSESDKKSMNEVKNSEKCQKSSGTDEMVDENYAPSGRANTGVNASPRHADIDINASSKQDKNDGDASQRRANIDGIASPTKANTENSASLRHANVRRLASTPIRQRNDSTDVDIMRVSDDENETLQSDGIKHRSAGDCARLKPVETLTSRSSWSCTDGGSHGHWVSGKSGSRSSSTSSSPSRQSDARSRSSSRNDDYELTPKRRHTPRKGSPNIYDHPRSRPDSPSNDSRVTPKRRQTPRKGTATPHRNTPVKTDSVVKSQSSQARVRNPVMISPYSKRTKTYTPYTPLSTPVKTPCKVSPISPVCPMLAGVSNHSSPDLPVTPGKHLNLFSPDYLTDEARAAMFGNKRERTLYTGASWKQRLNDLTKTEGTDTSDPDYDPERPASRESWMDCKLSTDTESDEPEARIPSARKKRISPHTPNHNKARRTLLQETNRFDEPVDDGMRRSERAYNDNCDCADCREKCFVKHSRSREGYCEHRPRDHSTQSSNNCCKRTNHSGGCGYEHGSHSTLSSRDPPPHQHNSRRSRDFERRRSREHSVPDHEHKTSPAHEQSHRRRCSNEHVVMKSEEEYRVRRPIRQRHSSPESIHRSPERPHITHRSPERSHRNRRPSPATTRMCHRSHSTLSRSRHSSTERSSQRTPEYRVSPSPEHSHEVSDHLMRRRSSLELSPDRQRSFHEHSHRSQSSNGRNSSHEHTNKSGSSQEQSQRSNSSHEQVHRNNLSHEQSHRSNSSEQSQSSKSSHERSHRSHSSDGRNSSHEHTSKSTSSSHEQSKRSNSSHEQSHKRDSSQEQSHRSDSSREKSHRSNSSDGRNLSHERCNENDLSRERSNKSGSSHEHSTRSDPSLEHSHRSQSPDVRNSSHEQSLRSHSSHERSNKSNSSLERSSKSNSSHERSNIHNSSQEDSYGSNSPRQHPNSSKSSHERSYRSNSPNDEQKKSNISRESGNHSKLSHERSMNSSNESSRRNNSSSGHSKTNNSSLEQSMRSNSSHEQSRSSSHDQSKSTNNSSHERSNRSNSSHERLVRSDSEDQRHEQPDRRNASHEDRIRNSSSHGHTKRRDREHEHPNRSTSSHEHYKRSNNSCSSREHSPHNRHYYSKHSAKESFSDYSRHKQPMQQDLEDVEMNTEAGHSPVRTRSHIVQEVSHRNVAKREFSFDREIRNGKSIPRHSVTGIPREPCLSIDMRGDSMLNEPSRIRISGTTRQSAVSWNTDDVVDNEVMESDTVQSPRYSNRSEYDSDGPEPEEYKLSEIGENASLKGEVRYLRGEMDNTSDAKAESEPHSPVSLGFGGSPSPERGEAPEKRVMSSPGSDSDREDSSPGSPDSAESRDSRSGVCHDVVDLFDTGTQSPWRMDCKEVSTAGDQITDGGGTVEEGELTSEEGTEVEDNDLESTVDLRDKLRRNPRCNEKSDQRRDDRRLTGRVAPRIPYRRDEPEYRKRPSTSRRALPDKRDPSQYHRSPSERHSASKRASPYRRDRSEYHKSTHRKPSPSRRTSPDRGPVNRRTSPRTSRRPSPDRAMSPPRHTLTDRRLSPCRRSSTLDKQCSSRAPQGRPQNRLRSPASGHHHVKQNSPVRGKREASDSRPGHSSRDDQKISPSRRRESSTNRPQHNIIHQRVEDERQSRVSPSEGRQLAENDRGESSKHRPTERHRQHLDTKRNPNPCTSNAGDKEQNVEDRSSRPSIVPRSDEFVPPNDDGEPRTLDTNFRIPKKRRKQNPNDADVVTSLTPKRPKHRSRNLNFD